MVLGTVGSTTPRMRGTAARDGSDGQRFEARTVGEFGQIIRDLEIGSESSDVRGS